MVETEREGFLKWLDCLLEEKDNVLQRLRDIRRDWLLKESEIEARRSIEKENEEEGEEEEREEQAVSREKPPHPKRSQEKEELQRILRERYDALKQGSVSEEELDPRLVATLSREVDRIRERTKKAVFETPLGPSEIVSFINAKNRKFAESVERFEASSRK